MTTVGNIYDHLNNIAPFSLQMSFDNAGFLVGRREQEVTRLLVALDVTPGVIQEARELDAQLIVTHHPVIFHPAKGLTDQDVLGRKLRALVACDIAVISAHTNLDLAAGGVNDALMEALGIPADGILQPMGAWGTDGSPYGLGRYGELEGAMEPLAFAQMVKDKLDCHAARVTLGSRPVKRVGVCGGSGGDMVADAVSLGCDAYVTGDVKYDQFLDAAALGITLIDAGHFPTENVICPVLARGLGQAFPGVEIAVSRTHHEVCFGV